MQGRPRLTPNRVLARNLLPLVALAVAAAAPGKVAAQPAPKMGTYTNASWRWSISYPTGWTVESNYPGLVEFRSATDNALCAIHSGPMDRFNTVDELTDFLLKHDEEFLKSKGQKFVVLARQRIKLPNGMAGNDVLAEIGPGGRSRRLHVLADGRGFAVDCEGYAKDWSRLDAIYRRIIASFAVRK